MAANALERWPAVTEAGLPESGGPFNTARRQRVQQVLDSIPADQRETIELAFSARLTYGEIAERTGVTGYTVQRTMLRALHAVREGLEISQSHDPGAGTRSESETR